MEFVNGRELKSYFEKNERFPMADVVRMMGEMLDALDYSHKNGVVHRDIKPANIIILADGQVKVADFGIARIESSQYTQAGTVLGTPAYMSPEQFMGQTVDGRSRYLFGRRGALPVPHRRAAVFRRGDHHHAQGAEGRAAGAVDAERAGAETVRRGHQEGDGQAPGGPLPDRA